MHALKKTSNYLTLVKWIVFIAILAFIYFKFKDNDNLHKDLYQIFNAAVINHWGWLLLALLMMPINWSLEAVKWQLLTRDVVKINFKQSMIGVITGLSLSFVTPHGVGDYFGRILQIKSNERPRLIGALLFGRILQMSVTAIAGLLGLYFLLTKTLFLNSIVLLLIFTIAIVLTYVQYRKLEFFNIKLLQRLDYYFEIIKLYSIKLILKVWFFAWLRYLVFAGQFLIILKITNSSMPFMVLIAGIAWIFLAKSILPSFNFLSDLGVREFSAIYFFEQMDTEIIPVLTASLIIWSVNILIPTLIGAPLVLRLKLKNG